MAFQYESMGTIPVVGCEVTLETRGLVSETEQGASGIEDLLHPNTPRAKLVHTLANDRQDALCDRPLRAAPLHLVLQGQARFWLQKEFRGVLQSQSRPIYCSLQSDLSNFRSRLQFLQNSQKTQNSRQRIVVRAAESCFTFFF